MIKTIRLEYFKIRRKKLWLMIMLFLVMELFWAFFAMSRMIARSPEQANWDMLIFNLSTMNGLFMPIISAIVLSRICDLEHKGATWKLLVACNVRRSHLYAAKYICANSLLLLGLFFQTSLMMAFGMIKNFPGSLPIGLFSQFILGSLLTTLAVTALQQWISLTVKNQAFALCVSMLGGFIGMTSGLFPATVRHLFIWSYYLDLSPVTFQYTQSIATYTVQPLDIGLVTFVLMMTFLFYLAGNIHLIRQEI